MTRPAARLIALVAIVTAAAAAAAAPLLPRLYPAAMQRLRGKTTVADRLAQYGPAARARLEPDFERAGVSYPPAQLTLLGLKHERRLHLYAGASPDDLRFVRAYPVLAASGGPGPKLRRGDRQVPEGLYRVESLNPNSLYHLSLRLDYPNRDDLARAQADGRADPGTDIMIHGRDASVGCLAMGDEAAEDLFTLAADTGLENITVVLAPADPRTTPDLPRPDNPPPWIDELHTLIRAAVARLPMAE